MINKKENDEEKGEEERKRMLEKESRIIRKLK